MPRTLGPSNLFCDAQSLGLTDKVSKSAQPGPQQRRRLAAGELLICARKIGLVGSLLKGHGPEIWPVLPCAGPHKPRDATSCKKREINANSNLTDCFH